MRAFLLRTLIALALVAVLHHLAALHADGWTDPFYLRFTSGKQRSLIVGTSRAAQGLKPDALNASLDATFEGPLFNFAFTVDHSPFGSIYLHALQAKLEARTTNGIFLVAVDPWSLSKEKGSDHMRESDYALAGQYTFTGHPNYEYLLRNYASGWGSLIAGPLHTTDTTMLLHADGWLEIRLAMDSVSVRERTKRKVLDYVDMAENKRVPSTERRRFLSRTIDLLRAHGNVILLRIPICDELADLEEAYWPGFSAQMGALAHAKGVQYLDFMPERGRFTYTDGNHLDSISARALSVAVASRVNAWPGP